MEWLATVRLAVLNVATPLAFSATDPRTVAPSLKVTDPVGTPVVLDFTVAVSVTVWWNEDGFTEETTVVKLAAFFTVCVRVPDALGRKLTLPP
jgi:hypothetical protein